MTDPAPASQQVTELDELQLLVVVDNETDTLSSVDEGVPQIPELGRCLARSEPIGEFGGHPGMAVFDYLCCACHGFSVLVTGRAGDETRTVLYDVGPFPNVWLENAEKLGIDLATIEAVFLSHWHADHSGGFPAVIGAIAAARSKAGRPAPRVDLHPDRPDRRGILLPNGLLVLLPEEPTLDAITSAGGLIETHAEPHVLCDGFFFGSGEIPRQTSYETGLAGHHSIRGQTTAPDPLIMDERFLAARVKGRGVSVLSACSHAGVVNACLCALDQFPGAPLDVVLGGYHLAGKAMEVRIPDTVRDLTERVRPRVVAPGHCSGWRAKAALARAFAPGRYAPSVVGSTYRLVAE